MLLKSVIACLAATAFVATTALMPTGASAGRGGPQPGTYNWPPYAEGGNMPRTTCGYVWVNPYPYKHRGQGRLRVSCHPSRTSEHSSVGAAKRRESVRMFG